MSGHASEELGILASITAALESTRTDITDIQIQLGDAVCRGHICLTIPLEDISRLEETRIETDNARIVGNEVHIDLDVAIEIEGGRVSENTSANAATHETVATDSARAHPAETPPEPPRTSPSADPGRIDAAVDPSDANEAKTTSPDEERVDTPGASQTDEANAERYAPYRDPDRLEAVYDEDATFKEMKAALGVDVTAQTVRKYMIKYGIHEPEPRPDRLLESVPESEFELMNADGREGTDQYERSNDTDASGSEN